MRSLQRGCRKAAAEHGFQLCINHNTPAQEPWALCTYMDEYKCYEVPAEGCRKATASHGFQLCINYNTPAQEPWALCISVNESTNAMRSLQRGCKKAAASHGF